MQSNRQNWNNRQKRLRSLLGSSKHHSEAIDLCLEQHGVLHSSKLPTSIHWSFEDEVLNDMTEDQIHRIPKNHDRSVAWEIWHIARIEDITMNMLIAGKPQLFVQGDWVERLRSPVRDTGNAMTPREVTEFSEKIDIKGLRAYRLAVGQCTQKIVRSLDVQSLKRRVNAEQLQLMLDQGAVVQEARGIVEYWAKRTIAELLLMPATRHNMVHLNRAARLKQRRQ